MKTSSFFALRYFFSRKSRSAINIIVALAALGVFIVSASLFVVLSVFDGLEEVYIKNLSDFDADIKISPSSGKTIAYDGRLTKRLSKNEYVEAYSAVLEQKTLASYMDRQSIAILKGVDNNYLHVVPADSLMVEGVWFTKDSAAYFPVTLGITLAYELGASPYDYYNPLMLSIPTGKTSFALNPEIAFSSVATKPSGFFASPDNDQSYIIAPLFVSEALTGSKNSISAYEVKIRNAKDIKKAKKSLEYIFGKDYEIKTRFERHEAALKMLNIEYLIVYAVFVLVLAIALFNVVAGVVMLKVEKADNIRTLSFIGANIRLIKRIFIKEGLLLVLLGGMAGLVTGVLIVILQESFALMMINPQQDIPYPVSFSVKNILIVLVTILGLGYVAALIGGRNSKIVY